MSYQTLEVENRDGAYVVTLNRPEKLNSLSVLSLRELIAVLDQVRSDDHAKVLVVTGAGRAFCAGADLSSGDVDLSSAGTIGDQVKGFMTDYFNPVVAKLHELNVPTIAAVNGMAAGGGVGLALACDLVVAARSAAFQLVFVPKLGIVPDMGTTWFLPRILGRAQALALSLLGEPISAERAVEIGLIFQCVKDDSLNETIEYLASKLSTASKQAVVRTRNAIDAGAGNSLTEQLALEADHQRILCGSDDFLRAMARFDR